jgi:hypothetical protein
MGDEKEAFLLRLDHSPGEFSRVMRDVLANDATYVVKTTNTVQNSRSPEPFRSVAVILPYERYEEMRQALAEMTP